MQRALRSGWLMQWLNLLKKDLAKTGNEYNTSGPVNVAMIFNELIIPVEYYQGYSGVNDLKKLAERTAKKLTAEIKRTEKEDWGPDSDDDDRKAMHLSEYRRLLKRLNKFVEDCGSW